MSDALSLFTTVPSAQRPSQLDFILLDGSGSMKSKWWDMLAALSIHLDALRAAALNSHVVLDVFSGTYNDGGGARTLDLMRYADSPLDAFPSLRDSPPGSTWGHTPLYDAINSTVRALRDLDPVRCSLVIVTDGEEAGSQFTDATQARALLDWCRAKGWSVTFIGADFDNSAVGSLLGSSAGAIGVSQARLSDAMSALAKKRIAYGLYGTDMHWSDGERETFGGYLAAPKGAA